MTAIRSISCALILTTLATGAFGGKDKTESASPFDIRYSVTPDSDHEMGVAKVLDSLKSSYDLYDAIKELFQHHQISEGAVILSEALTRAEVSIVDFGNTGGSLSVFHLAVMRNELDVIKALLALDKETVRSLLFSQTFTFDGTAWKHVGETALSLAVHKDRVEAAELILAAAHDQGVAPELIQVKIHRSTMGNKTNSNLFFWHVSEEMQKILNLYVPENADLRQEGTAALNNVLKATGLDKMVDQIQSWAGQRVAY